MEPVATLMLRRERTVCLPPPAGPEAAVGEQAVVAFEAELLALGAVLSAELRERFAALGDAPFAHASGGVLAGIADQLGADRPHVPLFRRFPASTPEDTDELFVRRVLAWWLQRSTSRASAAARPRRSGRCARARI